MNAMAHARAHRFHLPVRLQVRLRVHRGPIRLTLPWLALLLSLGVWAVLGAMAWLLWVVIT
jgi:hypothetical protein